MKIRLLLPMLILLASPSTSALEKSDEGVYALVHKDGHVTKKIAKLSQSDGRWHLEDLRPDGSWQDVTCGNACALVETTSDQVEVFLRGTTLEGTALECVHDQAFAFCNSTSADPRSYFMLAFSGGEVIPLEWVRLDPQTLEPSSAP